MFELDFPAIKYSPCTITKEMTEILGFRPLEAYMGRDYIFVLESEEIVRQITPDFAKMRLFPEGVGACVTARGGEYDFASRAFPPQINVDEDPVCGVMHCSLVPYWSPILGKSEMIAKQVSRREGILYLSYYGKRVFISGNVALFATSELHIEDLKFDNLSLIIQSRQLYSKRK